MVDMTTLTFLDFCVQNQKQKELKIQKQNKEKCFANLKE
jgi:hypothetical protein